VDVADGGFYYVGSPELDLPNDSFCYDMGPIGLTANPTGGSNPYYFLWNDSNFQQTKTAAGLYEGTYTVTVTDARGCFVIDSAVISSFPPPEGDSFYIVDCPGATYNLPSSDGGASYTWFPAHDLSSPFVAHPTIKLTYPEIYHVTIIWSTGCESVEVVELNVKSAPVYRLHIPNTFTPNNDGVNDFFEYAGWFDGITEFKCQIWDRWGERIFYTENVNEFWNGKYKNIGKYVKDGAYVYIISAEDKCTGVSKQSFKQVGWVIVLKD
jgi:gliding motility-associated-like protein